MALGLERDQSSYSFCEATKHCVEAAIRNYVTKKVIDGEATQLATVTAITTVCIELVRHELSLPTLPVLVLTDCFDMLTIKQCELLFSFVESNVGVWKEDTFFAPCKTSVLRMCNDLLRRLSRSQNTVFCGRILLFLARFFPFSERSGLNLVSEFNLENVTTFTNVETTDMDDDDDEGKGGDNRLCLDYTLYTKFWSLQDFFRNPVQCFQKAPWKMFTMYCGDVLEAFKSFKLDNVQGSGSGGAHLSRTLSEPAHTEGSSSLQPQVDQYFAKYLTNQKLLDLQFSDANFRRYVLLQILILAQYLTSNIKFKQETLTEDQSAWVKKTEDLVYTLLEETPPDGPVFVKTVKHILMREEMWSEWKNEGCPEFKKPEGYEKGKAKQNGKSEELKEDADKSPKKLRHKRKVGEIIRDADSKTKFSMGNAEMTRLWNLKPNNLEACKMPERDFVPALETYFTPAIEQLSPKSELREQDKLVNDSNFGWRGLRLLACRSPHFFTHSASPIATLPEYLTTMIKKLAKELPSQLTADIKVEEDDDKEEEKVIPVLEQNDGVKEDEEDMEEEGGDEERPEIKAITEEEQKALSKNLDQLGQDKWKLLAKKLGFANDEIEFIEKDKAEKEGSVENQVAFMLKLWVENDGDEANKECLLYTLEGLGMTAIADGVFT
ncbi:THO complex subunit 1-like isoform X2 [Homarus americanus]|uniref:THO complex subunit 1-like isoform X2 n=1 Tax=Homarus americanus TaxID=6706 RepID=UPI001C489AF0|nr:THO complex subunit 1-like isoform X2 [Homarus americanus]